MEALAFVGWGLPLEMSQLVADVPGLFARTVAAPVSFNKESLSHCPLKSKRGFGLGARGEGRAVYSPAEVTAICICLDEKSLCLGLLYSTTI